MLADSKYYFIFHIDVYQGENTVNIDMHPSLQKLPTTQKYDANDVINSVITNYLHGSRYIYIYIWKIYLLLHNYFH